MKRKLLTMTGLAAIAAVADITGEYNTWHGYHAGDNATGDRATVQGAAAGSGATYIERSEFIGAAAGAFSHDVADSVGLGYRALRGANSLSHVVAIGSGALAASTNLDSVTWINGQFYASENEDAFWIKPLRTAGAADPAQPGRCPVYYKNGVLREQVGFAIRTDDADRAAWENADAHVWLSSFDGDDVNDGLSPTGAVKTIGGAYYAAYIAVTNGTLNASNEIVVAVAEGVYAPVEIWKHNPTITNGISFVATGDRGETILDGASAPPRNSNGDDAPMFCENGTPFTMTGWTITRFNRSMRYSYSVDACYAITGGIKFKRCDITGNHGKIYQGWLSGDFEDCDIHGNSVRGWRGDAAYSAFGSWTGWGHQFISMRRCHIWDNDFSECAYLVWGLYSTVDHCLFEVDFYESAGGNTAFGNGGYDTVIAKTFSNPNVEGVNHGKRPGFHTNSFVVVAAPGPGYDESIYGIGDSCVVSNANLTADCVAADASCPSVRSDGKPDYGYRNSGFGPTATFEQRLGAYLVFEDGELCVYTNGVKAGTATFSPHNEE